MSKLYWVQSSDAWATLKCKHLSLWFSTLLSWRGYQATVTASRKLLQLAKRIAAYLNNWASKVGRWLFVIFRPSEAFFVCVSPVFFPQICLAIVSPAEIKITPCARNSAIIPNTCESYGFLCRPHAHKTPSYPRGLWWQTYHLLNTTHDQQSFFWPFCPGIKMHTWLTMRQSSYQINLGFFSPVNKKKKLSRYSTGWVLSPFFSHVTGTVLQLRIGHHSSANDSNRGIICPSAKSNNKANRRVEEMPS